MSPPPDSIANLLDSANETSRQVRTVYLTFILLSAYIGIVVGSTTDVQLLKGAPVRLPILDVDLPIIGFYVVAPYLVLIFHFNLLLQFYFLAKKLHRLDGMLGEVGDAGSAEDNRLRLFPFPFAHMLAGRHQSWQIRRVISLTISLTVIGLPLVILVSTLIRFLPYHDAMTTWSHRLAIVLDVIVLWSLWPLALDRHGSWTNWAKGAAAQLHGMVSSRRRGDAERVRLDGIGIMAPVTIAIMSFTFLVATIPDESLDRLFNGAAARYVFDSPGSPFGRNLRLSEEILLASPASAEDVEALHGEDAEAKSKALKKISGIDLRDRDLRFADLRGALLAKADLRGASLDNANLEQAVLSEADLRPIEKQAVGSCLNEQQNILLEISDQSNALVIPTKSEKASPYCRSSLSQTRLRDADLTEAKLTFARLNQANIEWAVLDYADLTNASLTDVEGIGARLNGAFLFKTDLTKAQLPFAELRGAQLERTTLKETRLWQADLRGVLVSDVNFVDVNLEEARLEGATLWSVEIDGTNAKGANFKAADLRDAKLNSGTFENTNFTFADLRGVEITTTEPGEFTWTGVHFAEPALCDKPIAGAECLQEPLPKSHLTAVTNYLKSLACKYPEVAIAFAYKAGAPLQDPEDTLVSIGLDMAFIEFLLDADCRGGSRLPEEAKRGLSEFLRDLGDEN